MIILYLFLLILLGCSTEPEGKDCAGIEGGSAIIDECGLCTGGTTGSVVNYLQDCSGECGGNAVADCLGNCNGLAVADECGTCDADSSNDCIQDCVGIWGGLANSCPDWIDCPSCYQNTSSMTAIVLDAILGSQIYDENDILAAFDLDGNVRGIALHLYPIPFGIYEGSGLYEIQIRGDESGDSIIFSYYDSSENEFLNSNSGYNFIIDGVIGDVLNPHQIFVNK